MQFATLSGLWFALSLPVIMLMYLLKRKYIDTEVSSHLLWSRVLKEMEANKPWQRLRNQMLLLLQLLVASLLVFALLQPFIWAERSDRDHVVLVFDLSASMSALSAAAKGEAGNSPVEEGIPFSNVATRLDEIKVRATNWVQRELRDRPVTLITIGAQAEVLLSRETDRSLIEQVISELQVHYGRTAYIEAMSMAAALTRDEDAEIRLFTDGQWTESSAGLTFNAPIFVERAGAAASNNVSIVRFGVSRSQSASEAWSAAATLKNWGEELQSFDAVVYGDNDIHFVHTETLEPGEQKTFFVHELPPAEVYWLEINANDLLAADNRQYAFPAGNDVKRALLLSEGNLFLEKALSLSGVTVVKAQLNRDDKFVLPESSFDFIVLDAIDPVSIEEEAWQSALPDYPVWYINFDLPGHNYSRTMPSTVFTIGDHPVTQYITFDDTHIANAQWFERIPFGEAVVSAGQVPLIIAGQAEGLPRLLFTFDLHDSDLPLRSEFPILIHSIAQWLGQAGSSAALGSAVAGEAIELSLNSQTRTAHWINAFTEGAVAEADRVNDAVANVQTVPAQPGLYYFMEFDHQGDELQARKLQVVMDARESNIGFIDPLQFTVTENLFVGEAGNTIEDESRLSDGLVPSSLIPWIILVLIIVILLEWGVYQRGSAL